jgi:hypothetical protein
MIAMRNFLERRVDVRKIDYDTLWGTPSSNRIACGEP